MMSCAWMKENAPKWKKMQDMMEKHMGGKGEDMAEMPETEPKTQAVTARDKDETPKEKAQDEEEAEKEKKGNDESEEKKEAEKEAKDGQEEEKKEAKDEEEKEKKKEASDAKQRRALDTAITRVNALESRTASHQEERRQVVDAGDLPAHRTRQQDFLVHWRL